MLSELDRIQIDRNYVEKLTCKECGSKGFSVYNSRKHIYSCLQCGHLQEGEK